MEEKEQKTFSYYMEKLRDYIEDLELENEVLEEIVKVQHDLIVKLAKEDDKEYYKSLRKFLD